jgi:hypothetical protein
MSLIFLRFKRIDIRSVESGTDTDNNDSGERPIVSQVVNTEHRKVKYNVYCRLSYLYKTLEDRQRCFF